MQEAVHKCWDPLLAFADKDGGGVKLYLTFADNDGGWGEAL